MPPTFGPRRCGSTSASSAGLERSVVDAVGLQVALVLGELGRERRRRAMEAQVARAPQHAEDARIRHQRLVLDDAALHQRPRRARGGGEPGGRGGLPVAVEPRRDLGQRAPVQVGLGPHVERVLRHQPDVARERVGHHALALDDAGVAVARLLAGPAPVDEHDRSAAFLEMEGRGRADHAGAEHDDVGVERIAQAGSRRFSWMEADRSGWCLGGFAHYIAQRARKRQLKRRSASARPRLCPRTSKRRP